MTSVHFDAFIKPAIRVASAGLGAAVGGPLGGALGVWMGGALGHSAAELIDTYAEEFGKDAGKKLFDTAGDTLVEKLKGEGPDLESVYRETLRASLSSVQTGSGMGFEDWFVHWELSLATPGRLNLLPIQQDDLEPEKLDQLLRRTLEDLDAQGEQIGRKDLSLKQQRRTMPDALFSVLQIRLPELLQEGFRLLIVRPENEQAWRQTQTAFEGFARASLKRIEEASRKIEDRTTVLPQVADDVSATRTDLTELRRILEKTLQPAAAPPPKEDAFHDFFETALSEGWVIHEDPWEGWHDDEERDFKKLMKGRAEEQFDLWRSENWQAVIALWEPLQSNTYFNIENPYWQDKPYFRYRVHLANCGLFVAYAQLTTQGGEEYLANYEKAIRYLKEVLNEHPYAMLGAAPNRLPVDLARAQNENFRTTLLIAQDFLRGHGGSVFRSIKIGKEEGDLIEKTIKIRLNEIQWVLDRHPEKP